MPPVSEWEPMDWFIAALCLFNFANLTAFLVWIVWTLATGGTPS